MLTAMSLKNGFRMVRTETPMVPLEADLLPLLAAFSPPQPSRQTAKKPTQTGRQFMIISLLRSASSAMVVPGSAARDSLCYQLGRRDSLPGPVNQKRYRFLVISLTIRLNEN